MNLSGSHCLVEWEEDGNPRNVVQRKLVRSLGDDNLIVGESCNVMIREGSKMVAYGAKLLGIGKPQEGRKYNQDISVIKFVKLLRIEKRHGHYAHTVRDG